jgi:hypothetical protein
MMAAEQAGVWLEELEHFAEAAGGKVVGVVSTASHAGRRIACPVLDYAPPWAADSLALRHPPSPGIISAAWYSV